jgi:hypothetical protein
MGLPLFAIPESLMPNLVTILRDNGVDVEERPLHDADDPEHFLMHLVCRLGKETAALSVQRELHINPNGPVVIIYPLKRRADNLIKRVSQLLQDNGAWVPKHPQPRQPA